MRNAFAAQYTMEKPKALADVSLHEIQTISCQRTRTKGLSLEGLRAIVDGRYDTYKDFALELGISVSAVSKFLAGTWVPKEPKRINAIAHALQIDPVKLTQLLERMAPAPTFVTADEYPTDRKI